MSPRYDYYPLQRGPPFLARKGGRLSRRTRVEKVFQQPVSSAAKLGRPIQVIEAFSIGLDPYGDDMLAIRKE